MGGQPRFRLVSDVLPAKKAIFIEMDNLGCAGSAGNGMGRFIQIIKEVTLGVEPMAEIKKYAFW